MRRILILFCFLEVRSDETNYPDINDLFPTSGNLSNINLNNSLDIRNIDVNQVMKKMEALDPDVTNENMIEDARRQALTWTKHGKDWYMAASDHMIKQKTTDLMLQLIYMARSILKKLEEDPNFSKGDTGFRIGFLFVKLIKLVILMRDIYAWMAKNKNLYPEAHLKMHQRAAKVHVDFLYFWRVLIKLDGKDMDVKNQKPTLPTHLEKTGGFSFEVYEEEVHGDNL